MKQWMPTVHQGILSPAALLETFRMVQVMHGTHTHQPMSHGHRRGHCKGLVRVAAMHLLAQRPRLPTGEEQPCNLPPQRSVKSVML